VTAQAARGYGIPTAVASDDHTNAGLVGAIVGHYRAKR
jgi:uroporphyrinogen-III synthase